MTVGATRHFESSFATVEWLLDERADDLTDEQIAACAVYHDLLIEISEDLWGVTPPSLPEKNGDVPLHPDMDEEYFIENHQPEVLLE